MASNEGDGASHATARGGTKRRSRSEAATLPTAAARASGGEPAHGRCLPLLLPGCCSFFLHLLGPPVRCRHVCQRLAVTSSCSCLQVPGDHGRVCCIVQSCHFDVILRPAGRGSQRCNEVGNEEVAVAVRA